MSLTPENSPETTNTGRYEEYLNSMGHAGFRKTGLLSPGSLDAAITDPDTIYMPGGVLPAFTPIEKERFYNSDRCGELTNGRRVFLYCRPLAELSPEFSVLAPRNSAIVVERYHHESDQQNTQEENSIAGMLGGKWHNFKGERYVKDGIDYSTAWMAMYGFSIEPKFEDGPRFESLFDAWRNVVGAGRGDKQLYAGSDVVGDGYLMEHLWDISLKGFGKVLGKDHPISMEVNYEFFKAQLDHPDVYVAIKHNDTGQPICFGSLALDLDHNPWLDMKSKQMINIVNGARNNKELLAHFFEVISDDKNGRHAADLFADLLAAAGSMGPMRVIFESTNLSARYIPAIVAACIESNSSRVNFRDGIKQVGRLDYGWVET